MNITDVPTSGVYFQQGAIVQIVVEIIDINTGEPVQLQTATGLSISVLYPDLATSQVFAAEKYTDGSDGKIVYTTINDGTTIDLSQVGLYQVQGNGVVNSVPLPPTYLTDFYVLKNVVGTAMPPIFNTSSMIFYDATGVRWGLTINPSGDQTIVAQTTLPTSFIYFAGLVMKDASGIYWTASMSTGGVLTWTQGGSFSQALESFTLNDINGRSWLFTISEAGQLEAA